MLMIGRFDDIHDLKTTDIHEIIGLSEDLKTTDFKKTKSWSRVGKDLKSKYQELTLFSQLQLALNHMLRLSLFTYF